jgi:hypothetical protein
VLVFNDVADSDLSTDFGFGFVIVASGVVLAFGE